jgi:DNA helicase-2/ATP-dependent DNA helicase PcrA
MKKLPLMKLSASSIKTYEQCPRKYWYNYIEKPEIPAKEWDHLTLGNFVHEVLEHFHNILLKNKRDHRKLMSYVCKEREKELNKKGELKYKLNPEVRKQVGSILMSYLDYLEENGMPNVQSNEQRFSVHIDDDLLVRGIIDRIDLGVGDTPDRYHVVDYKTGKSKYLDEFQLLLYGIPLLEDNPDVEMFKGSYLALKEDMKWLSYDISRTDVENVKEKIRSVARQIREDKTWQPKPQFLCRYCDFESICDAAPNNQFKNFRGGEIGWD